MKKVVQVMFAFILFPGPVLFDQNYIEQCWGLVLFNIDLICCCFQFQTSTNAPTRKNVCTVNVSTDKEVTDANVTMVTIQHLMAKVV